LLDVKAFNKYEAQEPMSTTTKKDLIDRIAEETNQKRTVVKTTVQSFLDNVIQELSMGNRLEFRDFGVFEIRDRAPRMAQNPRTLERVPVPAKRTVKFKVGRLMRDALENEGESQAMKVEATVEVPPMESVPSSD
jgi:integration host factor subunit beta